MKQLLPGCEVVFDIGANVGNWGRMALEANPSVELHCFEPAGAAFRTLQSSGFPRNVHLNHCALGDEEGSGELHVHEWGENSSLHPFAGEHEDGQIGRETVPDFAAPAEYRSERWDLSPTV